MYSGFRYSLHVILVLAVSVSISRAPWTIPYPVAAASAFASPDSADRAKTGPSGVPIENRLPQELNDKAFAAGGGNEAERERFELSKGFKPFTAFPVLLLRPLGHLSRPASKSADAPL